jgi:predicted anti-sigma-YlaC factor YlaD
MADAHEHLSCQEVVELVTDYLEGAMSARDAALIEQHLNLCDGCARYVDQMRTTIATVGRIEEADVPPAVRAALVAAYRGRSGT